MKTDGGPAFPMAGYTEMVEGRPHTLYAPMNGMTLRDYFAAQALTGYLLGARSEGWAPPNPTQQEFMARNTYEMADAMLAAREKKDVI